MTVYKFSKSYGNIFKIKKDFYLNNDKHLKKSLSVNKVYKSQTERKFCKICNSKKLMKFINSFGIDYLICKKCSHLNGKFDDSDSFRNYLYFRSSGKNYSNNYKGDYKKRVKNIYQPKLDFLKSVIKKKFDILDIGCGGGHFISACENSNISAIGYDPGKDLVNLGVKFLKKNQIHHSNEKDFVNIIENTKKKVVSMLGVLEHVYNPNNYFAAFKNSNAKYLFFKVPLLSFSTFLENSNQNVFPRQLSHGHTHLFTFNSIKYILKKYNFIIMGEWWFGTDIPDLLRTLLVNSNYNNKKIYEKNLNIYFTNIIDDLQKIIDVKKLSSEIHIVIKKK